MSKYEKLRIKLLDAKHDKNLRFTELQYILRTSGFVERIVGDHYIYTKTGIEEIINIQPDGKSAKPYQVKQVRQLFEKYNMEDSND